MIQVMQKVLIRMYLGLSYNQSTVSFFFFPLSISIDSGVLTTEQDLTTEKLYNELQRVKEDLKSKDNEIIQVRQLRENTDREIQDLTASLFEVINCKRNLYV